MKAKIGKDVKLIKNWIISDEKKKKGMYNIMFVYVKKFCYYSLVLIKDEYNK